jgi:hypothetical protein
MDMHMLSPRMLTLEQALVPRAPGFDSHCAEASMDAPTFMRVFDSAMARLRTALLVGRRVTMRHRNPLLNGRTRPQLLGRHQTLLSDDRRDRQPLDC